MKSLIEYIPELIREGKSFAYMCKFKDGERKHGTEHLYTGEKIIRSQDSKILDSLEKDTPVVISFPYAFKIFNMARESSYPPLMALIPENVMKNSLVREQDVKLRSHEYVFHDDAMERKIELARERIRKGEILQVVLSRKFGPLNIDPMERLESFLNYDRSMYVFYYRFNEFEIMGSSPENTVTLDGRELMIEPIAGTRPVSSDPEENMRREESLLNDEKELLEHRMLVDLARNDLGRISEYGTVKVTRSMEIRKFSSVMHIVSRVQSTLRDGVKKSQILDSVFPAGTVSGAPKERATGIIGEYEDDDRGPYAGAIGVAGKDSMDLALTIRCIYTMDGNYYTRAGAGIVKDSVPEKEVMEMFSKSLSAMGGVNNEVSSYQ